MKKIDEIRMIMRYKKLCALKEDRLLDIEEDEEMEYIEKKFWQKEILEDIPINKYKKQMWDNYEDKNALY